MGGSPPSAPSNTTTSSTNTPWGGASQYLTNANSTYNPETGSYSPNPGAAGPTGAYELAANYANQYQNLSGQQQNLISQQQTALGNQSAINNTVFNNNNAIGQQAINGDFNTHFNAAPNASASNFGMGAADPTNALSHVLSGNVDNPYLARMAQANVDSANQQFQGDITAMNTQVMPGINNDAFAAGQYGSSRQGIAQGMALQGLGVQGQNLATNVGNANANLYGQAYQNAQNNQAQAANNLAGMGVQNNQFNSSLAGQNNAAQMAQNAQNFNNASLGAGMQTNAMGNMLTTQDQLYNQQQQLAQMPQNQQLSALNAYLGAVSPGASLGGSSMATQSTPYYTASPLQQALGAGTAGAGLVSALSSGGK